MSNQQPTASSFRDPLLRALGTLTGLVAGQAAPSKEVMAQVYADLGITEDTYGTDKGSGQPQVRIWLNQVFNKNLRPKGLADSPSRGQWALTDEGVTVASLLVTGVVATPAAVDEFDTLLDTVADNDPEPEPEPEAPVLPAAHEGGTGVAWSLGEQTNTYNPDPYIRGLAVAQTKCFGRYSERSDVCGGCGLSGACKAETVTLMASVAARLRQRDAEAKRRAEEAARRAAMPTPPPQPKAPSVHKDDADLNIDDILAAIENEDPKPEPKSQQPNHKKLAVPADSKCHACGGKIPQNDDGIWVQGEGVYHPDCFNQKYGA